MIGCEILSKVIELSNASVDIDRRLMNLADALAVHFSVPLCALFLWDPQESRLSLKACSQTHPDFPGEFNISEMEGSLRLCALRKSPVIIADASQLSLWDPPIPKNLSAFHFWASYPIVDDIALYGVLALLGQEPRQLTDEERFLLPVICRQLAGAIRSAQVNLQAKKRIAELSTLHAIGIAISSTSNLGELLKRTTLTSAKILQADGGILQLLDEEGGMLKAVSSYGWEENAEPLSPLPLGEEVAGMVALKGESILLRDAIGSPFSFKGYPSGISSVICVPLISQSKTIGTLSLFSLRQSNRQEKVFDEEDKNLLSTMASQIAMAIENAIILQRAELLASDKERAVRELSLLYEVSRSMLTTIKLDQLFHIILVSVTLGTRPGFDRAALFLIDEKENVLKGMMGVGSKDREEANRWRQKFEEHRSSSMGWIAPEEMRNTPYDLEVVQVRIPLDKKPSILIKTLQKKRTYHIENAALETEVDPETLNWFGNRAFAAVPLVAREKAIGLITVDNHLSERPITDEDIGFLNLLANQAALAIENSRLYKNLQEINTQFLKTQNRLIQSEKLAALGEVVASIAHEIKNPLVSIGGFARRLDRNLPENTTDKKYIRIVLKEVKRLEDILTETLTFCKEPFTASGRHDLNSIIEECLSTLGEFLERNISIEKALDRTIPPLFSDPQQMKQVFLNLFVNATQAMGQNGKLMVTTSVQNQGARRVIQIEVGDTGGGIRREILDNIFNPFFTTKQEGTGLGLPIAHKIVTYHKGDFEVINNPGVGATFVIRFPIPG